MIPEGRRVGTWEEIEVRGNCTETGGAGRGGYRADSQLHEMGNSSMELVDRFVEVLVAYWQQKLPWKKRRKMVMRSVGEKLER